MNFKRYNESDNSWTDSHYIKGTDTETITTLPATIYPLGQTVTLGLKGNSVQNGTPSPDSPVMPEGTGEKTGNLLNVDSWYGNYKQPDGTYKATRTQLYAIKIKPFTSDDIGKTFTFAMDIAPVSGKVRVTANNGGTVTNGDSAARSVVTFTVATVDDTIYFNYGSSSDTITTISNIMLNLGSTARPYEPHGYKIPISSGGLTTNVYLGEVETTRKIKKLVLTGEENTWTKSGSISNTFYCTVSGYLRQRINITMCSHYTSQANISGAAEMRDSNVSFYANAGQTVQYFYVRDSNFATVADLKSYLAAQYAAGTPVTVWYVLATPTTGIVNEPLMKIGDYADSLTTSIPCTAGENTLDVQTTVAPSEVTATFEGWHPVSAAHERSGGAWD